MWSHILSPSKSIGTVEIEYNDMKNDAMIESLDPSTKHDFIGAIVYFEKTYKINLKYFTKQI